VFDWNRTGLDNKPRALHVEQSLANIDFKDIEPGLIPSRYSRNETLKVRYVLRDPLFMVDACVARRGLRFYLRSDAYQILAVLKGRLGVGHGELELELGAGQFCLLPACLDRVRLLAERQTEYLHIQHGEGS
jgi:mannose-6-phosphate isomerase